MGREDLDPLRPGFRSRMKHKLQREDLREAAQGELCQPHLERVGVEVLATVVIADEPMCRDCFRGLPLYASKLLPRKRATPEAPELHSILVSTLDPTVLFTVNRKSLQ